MRQRGTKKRPTPTPAARQGKKLPQPREGKRLPEAEAQLQMKADEARRKNTRKLIMAGAKVFIIVSTCVLSAFPICSPAGAGDRQTGIALLSGLSGLVLSTAHGKRKE